MKAFVSGRGGGGSFVAGIGVGGSGRVGRGKIVLSVSSPDPLSPRLLSPRSRVAGPRWLRKSLPGCGRSTGRSTNWSKIELARDNIPRIRLRFNFANASFCSPRDSKSRTRKSRWTSHSLGNYTRTRWVPLSMFCSVSVLSQRMLTRLVHSWFTVGTNSTSLRRPTKTHPTKFSSSLPTNGVSE